MEVQSEGPEHDAFTFIVILNACSEPGKANPGLEPWCPPGGRYLLGAGLTLFSWEHRTICNFKGPAPAKERGLYKVRLGFPPTTGWPPYA